MGKRPGLGTWRRSKRGPVSGLLISCGKSPTPQSDRPTIRPGNDSIVLKERKGDESSDGERLVFPMSPSQANVAEVSGSSLLSAVHRELVNVSVKRTRGPSQTDVLHSNLSSVAWMT